MTREYILGQWDNFGSIFSESKHLDSTLYVLRTERSEKLILEWAGWGWNISKILV